MALPYPGARCECSTAQLVAIVSEIDPQDLIERGWLASLLAPPTRPEDRDARLGQLEEAFTALAPVFRPLALEVERCWRELDPGLPSRDATPQPVCRLVTSLAASSPVVPRPTIANPPSMEIVAALDRRALTACLEDPSPTPPGVLLDWRVIRTIAAAVRSFAPGEEFLLRPAGKVVRALEPGWFAGPLGTSGFEGWPPAQVIFVAEDRVELALHVHWSRWRVPESPERSAFEHALTTLEDRGWQRC
ncbi:MAG: hypothetical protein ACOZQL_34795 [Myxococcota bacterium]